jgi:hypothetical protein
MFTPLMTSSTVTMPSMLQSPLQWQPAGPKTRRDYQRHRHHRLHRDTDLLIYYTFNLD